MNSKYYLAVITTYVIYGLFSLPLKAIDAYASLDILLSRLLMAGLLILFFSFVFRRKITFENFRIFKHLPQKEKQKVLMVNIISSVLLAANYYLFIYVMNRVSVNATALAYMLCPIINTFLAYIFLKDRLSNLQWIAIGLSMMSCFMLAFGDFSETLYAFAIGLIYATYLVLQKNNIQLDRFFTLTFQLVVAIVIMLPFWSYRSPEPEKTWFYFGIIFMIAALFTIIPMYLNVLALNKLSSSTAGIFIYLNPVLSFSLALFYFHEKMSGLKILAYAIVFFSVILFNIDIIRQLLKIKKA